MDDKDNEQLASELVDSMKKSNQGMVKDDVGSGEDEVINDSMISSESGS